MEGEELKRILIDSAIKFNQGVQPNGKPCSWIADCREVLLIPRGAYLISKLIYEKLRKFKSRQVGGLTLAANPIVSYLVLLAYQDKRPVSGFIIRKEPKYNGLQKLIEGDFKPGEPVVLVDDLINSGGSIFRAIEAVEEQGCKVEGVLSILNFGNQGEKKLKEKGYRFEYLFTLEDLGVRNKPENIIMPKILWEIKDINMWEGTIPRSSPVQFKKSILFGTNEGKFFSLQMNSGKINWERQFDISVPKGILSSPAIKENNVYFGAYDGFLYCLDAKTGKTVWKKQRGDWIGSSPYISGGELFIGVEYGKKGGVLIACSVKDGKLLWYLETGHYIHSTPAVDSKRNVVIVGCNDGFVYAADSKTGKLIWKYETGKETRAGFAIDEKTGKVYFGSEDGNMYCFEISNGNLIWKRRVGFAVYNTPEIVDDNLVFSTVSRRIFCLDKETGSIRWYYNTEGRIFSYTYTVDNRVYCGSNNGYLYVIELSTGKLLGIYKVGKEILTKPLMDGNKVYIGCKGQFISIII